MPNLTGPYRVAEASDGDPSNGPTCIRLYGQHPLTGVETVLAEFGQSEEDWDDAQRVARVLQREDDLRAVPNADKLGQRRMLRAAFLPPVLAWVAVMLAVLAAFGLGHDWATTAPVWAWLRLVLIVGVAAGTLVMTHLRGFQNGLNFEDDMVAEQIGPDDLTLGADR